MDKIANVIQKRNLELMTLKNVIAVGRGYKIRGGVPLSQECVTVTVRKKEDVPSSQRIPAKISGVITDVVESDDIVALGYKERERPALGGCSIGHFDITAGTFGCVVRAADGKRLILSNNHVLANSNEASLLDAILQPGFHDGGRLEKDTIAWLDAFIPIVWEDDGGNGGDCAVSRLTVRMLNFLSRGLGRNSRMFARSRATSNLVDAAVACPERDSVVREIHDIGHIGGMIEPMIDMSVKKTGRTTGHTRGTVTQTDVTVRVGYGGSRTALFVDQLMFSHMSEPGDSGSMIVDENNRAVALLFAGSSTTTIACKIKNVFYALDLKWF